MRAFADLLERLAFTPARNGKLTLLTDFFAARPDPERGYGLAALTGDLGLRQVTPSLLRGLVAERVDETLFALSYDFVGDLAETIALIWPEPETPASPSLPGLVEELQSTGRAALPGVVAGRLDEMTASERYAYLKLATGGMRVGVSARLARLAVAQFGDLPVTEIEELWHGLAPPYASLFAWAEGGEKQVAAALAPFRPVMLSTPTDLEALRDLSPSDYVAEWKWDGIRVQAVSDGGVRRLYSRTGEDISPAFPDVIEALDFEGTLDGELLVRRGDAVAPFGDLQKRLNRKTAPKTLLASHPAALRIYDILIDAGQDIRSLPFTDRRNRLEHLSAGFDPSRLDLSPLLAFESWDDIAALRADPPDPVIEGVMIKHRDSPYLAGRIRGHWFKWKRDPMLIDAVLMTAQRGHGKRSGYYSDYGFGVWDGDQLVPVGKAYFGFTDEELKELDRFVRQNTTDRFGPVRAVAPKLVLEIAFEGLNRSKRHKSGVAMRFPRIARIRRDKPAAEADRLETLREMLPPD
ncbi:DNA ligase [Pseudooceanicola batsensis HTCC2597]|uniref:DNA ligase (ATP) n=1 Tax=Pseudooceanicola batsensis (strain ATCC BAA-863 / DSM 15984 / KCTC 12145 / HTCC2597) TaxID=252305 RepID=A3TXM8_PSEBH|nr:cisplatin damage response ATP-dependent DNA ligase [Pseudooceanicola batsensis]EAQ03588.1 DNA ligase [Pseudooceanicola batsensis HTCC2597]